MPEASVTITARTATPGANDVLTVTGDVVATFGADTYSAAITATGWVSATRNHYDPEDYEDTDSGRHLKPDAQSRQMSASEVREYVEGLLLEAFVAATPLVRQVADDLLTVPDSADLTAPVAGTETGGPPEIPHPADTAPDAEPTAATQGKGRGKGKASDTDTTG